MGLEKIKRRLTRLVEIDPFGLVPKVRWFGNQKSSLSDRQFFRTTAYGSRAKELGTDSDYCYQTFHHSGKLSGVNKRGVTSMRLLLCKHRILLLPACLNECQQIQNFISSKRDQ